MDIPVSRLNQRMALQLPSELPLGLVFVVGRVQLPGNDHPGRTSDFYLIDDEYRLRCRFSQRAAAEVQLGEGDMVRAGGHLAFEPARASYYLLARDVEILDSLLPAANPLAAIIADSNRRGQSSALVPAAVPPWIQQMAPPEIRRQQADLPPAASLASPLSEPPDDWELLADTRAAMALPADDPGLAGMSDELIAFLSQAMDLDQEVEITAEIIADLNSSGTTERLPADLLAALDELEASVGDGTLSLADQATGQTTPAQSDVSGESLDDIFDESANGQYAQLLLLLDELESELTSRQGIAAPLSADIDEPASGEPDQPAGEPEPDEAVTAARSSTVSVAPSRRRPPRNQVAKQPRLIPWYVVLLVVLVVLVLLVAVVYVILYPPDLSLNLPVELPILS